MKRLRLRYAAEPEHSRSDDDVPALSTARWGCSQRRSPCKPSPAFVDNSGSRWILDPEEGLVCLVVAIGLNTRHAHCEDPGEEGP